MPVTYRARWRKDATGHVARFAGQPASSATYEDRAVLEEIVSKMPNGDQVEIVEVLSELDLLLRAAKAMRDRAGGVFPFHSSPWRVELAAAGHVEVRSTGVAHLAADEAAFFDGQTEVAHDTYVFEMDTASTAEHIASWHPGVGLVAAELLEHVAARAKSKIEHGGNARAVWSSERDALRLACTYLGEEVPA
jgi:hypothetical protein